MVITFQTLNRLTVDKKFDSNAEAAKPEKNPKYRQNIGSCCTVCESCELLGTCTGIRIICGCRFLNYWKYRRIKNKKFFLVTEKYETM